MKRDQWIALVAAVIVLLAGFTANQWWPYFFGDDNGQRSSQGASQREDFVPAPEPRSILSQSIIDGCLYETTGSEYWVTYCTCYGDKLVDTYDVLYISELVDDMMTSGHIPDEIQAIANDCTSAITR